MCTEDNVLIDAIGSPELRKGTYSNVASITSLRFEDVIDFYFIDGTSDSGALRGTLVSRIIMSREALIGLRDAIDQQINKQPGKSYAL